MTGDDTRRNVADAVQRARQATRAAEALLTLELHRDAVSRAYCAAYHWIQALLLARGLSTTTQSGAFQLLHREFLRPGVLPNVLGWQLAGLQRSREQADYESAIDFTSTEVRSMLAVVAALASDAEAILRNESLLD